MADLVKTNETSGLIPFKEVEDKIVVIRGQEVLLDCNVAELYGVETREVNQAVRNNPRKFREGYIIELTAEESTALRSKILTLEPSKGKGRYSKLVDGEYYIPMITETVTKASCLHTMLKNIFAEQGENQVCKVCRSRV